MPSLMLKLDQQTVLGLTDLVYNVAVKLAGLENAETPAALALI